jgi:hypothetical protein
MSLDNGNLAWADPSNVYACGTGCPSPFTVASTGSAATVIGADGTAVLWSDGASVHPITAVGVDGGSGRAGTGFAANVAALAVTAGSGYWTGSAGVTGCEIDHCATSELQLLAGPADAGWIPSAISFDKIPDGGSHLYWSGVRSIEYCLRSMCAAATLASTALPSVPSIAVSTASAVNVYWVDQSGIMQVLVP